MTGRIDDRLWRIETRLVQLAVAVERVAAAVRADVALAVSASLRQEKIMSALDNLEAQVAPLDDAVASASALLDLIHDDLQEALASGDPGRVQAVADRIAADRDALAAAVARNTPAAPAEPTEGGGTGEPAPPTEPGEPEPPVNL